MSSRGLPEVLMQKVDDYVDSLAPQIQPRIASELEDFQQKTIDSLETQVVDAFRSLFNKNGRPSSSDGSRSGPWNLNDAAPDAYGGQSLPFADEIAKLTRSFGQISDEAGGDLRDIFDLTEGSRGGVEQNRSQDVDFSSGARGFLSSALNVVQDSLDERGSKGGQSFEIGGMLGMISSTIKDASQNPEEKARLISPEIKQTVGDKLRSQHAPIAEQFTRIALEHIKRWLRGNTSSRDLGDGAKAEIAEQVGDLVKGLGSLFGSKKSNHEESARGFDDSSRDGDSGSGGGFSRVISDKLSTGLAKVHREVRLEFRKILGQIEKQLFELLPDQFQRPLEKILGGNPFDSQLDRDASANADRGFGDDIKSKLLSKIRDLVQKVQETLRESILGVVNGGHRRFERQSWVFVQSMVEQKVQRYLPDVKINVPDDIGNENVSVGDPSSGSQYTGGAGGHQPPSHQSNDYHNSPPRHDRPPPQTHDEPPQYHHEQQYSGHHQSQQYPPPPPQQDYRPEYHAPPPQSDYASQDYRQEHYAQPPQSYHHQAPPTDYQSGHYPPPPPPPQQGYQQQGYPSQGYGQRDYREEEYRRHEY
ncbi:C6 zinc finger-like protein [Stemphylium lycopersici]|uniref:C6 zinc finger-like protein n=1 Tax=Stemphylium lycopersici TaxID=183478 RepID=A0A364N4F0_STELY|nr:C6 zinc finger-like protein [Stemphylium lycopersici]